MSSTLRRVMPAATLIGLAIFAALAAYIIAPFDLIPVAVVVFVVLFPFWFMFQGGGLVPVGRGNTVVRKDLFGNIDTFEEGQFPFMPIFHTVEARIPNYPLKHELAIETIDTRTKFLNQIKQIKARVHYRVIDFYAFYKESANLTGRVLELEEQEKLKREEPILWKRVLNELMHGTIDDVAREVVWHWDTAAASEPNLQIIIPFTKNFPSENDPYTLSLNRVRLAQQIRRQLNQRFDAWGITIEKLVFETVEVDADLIKRQTRNKPGEVEEAELQAKIAAVGISLKGYAEAEVRAATIAKVLEELIKRKDQINLTNEVLYNIVRAAMYSDGEMVWQGVVEPKPGSASNGAGTVKTA